MPYMTMSADMSTMQASMVYKEENTPTGLAYTFHADTGLVDVSAALNNTWTMSQAHAGRKELAMFIACCRNMFEIREHPTAICARSRERTVEGLLFEFRVGTWKGWDVEYVFATSEYTIKNRIAQTIPWTAFAQFVKEFGDFIQRAQTES